MPVSSVDYHDDGGTPPERTGVTIVGTGHPTNPNATTMYSDISGPPGNPAWLGRFAEHLQDQIDLRIARDDPQMAGDPDILEDPEKDYAFWDGGDIVYRSVVVEVEWDEAAILVKVKGTHQARGADS